MRLALKDKSGFTLIELLIVIAVIGILAAVLISVLDPGAQRTRANETVLRSNVDKLCLAWGACNSSSSTGAATACDTATELGVTLPTVPTGATYSYTSSRWQGVLGTCTVFCDATTNIPTLSGTCLIN